MLFDRGGEAGKKNKPCSCHNGKTRDPAGNKVGENFDVSAPKYLEPLTYQI